MMNNQLLKNKKEIIDWLEKYNITNYTLIPDNKYGFVVDVNNDVNLSKKKLNFIPIKFNKVNGGFWCDNNNLTLLKGCPEIVGGNFDCGNNQLTTLKYSPKVVDGGYNCSFNLLTSLYFCPKKIKYIFDCSYNNLISLKGAPKKVLDFMCGYNKLKSLKDCPKNIERYLDCGNNKFNNFLYLPEKFSVIIYKFDEHVNYQALSFNDAYKIHLKDKSDYEKKLLNENINFKNVDKNNNCFKI